MKSLLALLATVFIPFFTVAQAPKSSPRPKSDECKVSGMVVKLEGSEPLRKAKVQLQGTDDDPSHNVSVVTDAGGRFELKHIDPGRYKLRVSRAGFVVQEYGQKKPDDPGAILTLRPGQEVKDLLFRLIPSGVIAGRILDEDGEPLASVVVSALREVYSEGKRSLSTWSTVSTDDLGQYRLFGLAPGRYFVSAVYPHWGRFGGNGDDSDGSDSQQGYAKMFYPGTPDRAKALSLTLKAGEEVSSIEILMRQVLVYRVRGHVYNQITHKPGTEMGLMLMPKRTGREWEFSNQQASVQKRDGSFDIPEVLPGSYVLIGFWFDEGKTYSTRVPVEVGNADVEGITVTIGPGQNINGRIIWDGQPSLQGADLTVTARSADSGVNFWGNSARVTQALSFTLKDVSEGRYFAEVSGYSKDCYVKDVRYGSSSALDDGFMVAPGASASLEITISSHGARVQGSIFDTENLPAAGVWLVLVPDAEHRTQSRRYKTQTTDQYGHFELRGIAPGDYKLFSWEEVESGAWEDPEFLKPFEGKGESVSLQEGEQKTVNLTAIRTKAPEEAKP